ncbi:hypothetical protein D1B31_21075 [Neobacillus notoginsengisoli]|uniref:Uncharacterized protein n=1 Tax=Neobacillus notoginsengisoli TaxID=1578198 RepID=A0A417YIN6_9BACI|nr:DUF6616 family protein [Neobacillus notoginsengisoli]RHW32840.1 hypothetical protein D1B31_21075 [Neobacillus notoginsengisoli]
MSQEREVGFVAFWKATDSWFNATEQERADFMDKIEIIFKEAEAKGIKRSGIYDCSWSSEWRYFTFWTAPNTYVIEEVMEKLLDIGDINHYNIQHHYIGRKIKGDIIQ